MIPVQERANRALTGTMYFIRDLTLQTGHWLRGTTSSAANDELAPPEKR
jgi:hypothetical protein